MLAWIAETRSAFASWFGVWRSTELQIFGSNVLSVLLYCSETWKFTHENTDHKCGAGFYKEAQVFGHTLRRGDRNIARQALDKMTGKRSVMFKTKAENRVGWRALTDTSCWHIVHICLKSHYLVMCNLESHEYDDFHLFLFWGFYTLICSICFNERLACLAAPCPQNALNYSTHTHSTQIYACDSIQLNCWFCNKHMYFNIDLRLPTTHRTTTPKPRTAISLAQLFDETLVSLGCVLPRVLACIANFGGNKHKRSIARVSVVHNDRARLRKIRPGSCVGFVSVSGTCHTWRIFIT